jgi:hypothetical protein
LERNREFENGMKLELLFVFSLVFHYSGIYDFAMWDRLMIVSAFSLLRTPFQAKRNELRRTTFVKSSRCLPGMIDNEIDNGDPVENSGLKRSPKGTLIKHITANLFK